MALLINPNLPVVVENEKILCETGKLREQAGFYAVMTSLHSLLFFFFLKSGAEFELRNTCKSDVGKLLKQK